MAKHDRKEKKKNRLVQKVWFLCEYIPRTSLRRHSLTANPGLHKGDVIKADWGLFSSPGVVTEGTRTRGKISEHTDF